MSTAAFVLPREVRHRDVADSVAARVRGGLAVGPRSAPRRAGLLAAAAALCALALVGTRPSDELERPTIRPAPPPRVELVVTIPSIRLDFGPIMGLDPAPAAAAGCG